MAEDVCSSQPTLTLAQNVARAEIVSAAAIREAHVVILSIRADVAPALADFSSAEE